MSGIANIRDKVDHEVFDYQVLLDVLCTSPISKRACGSPAIERNPPRSTWIPCAAC